jgi:hypothetical protein
MSVSGPAASSFGAGPGAPSRSRKRIWIAAGSVVAVAVVIGSLLATGVISLGGSAGPRGVPFSQARSEGTTDLEEHYPGSWSLLAGTGVDDDAPATVSLANVSAELGANCTPMLPPGVSSSSTIYVPPYRGAWSAGLSPFWILLFSEPSVGAYAVALVVNGTAVDATELLGSGCASSVGSIQALPATVADSPAAAGAAWTSAGAADVHADARLSAMTMVALGNYSHGGITLGSEWILEYKPCGAFVSGPTNETEFVNVLDIATGAYSTSYSTADACPTPPP